MSFADLIPALSSRRLNEILTALSEARDRVLLFENSPSSGGSGSPSSLVPYVLAAIAYAANIPIPGEDISCQDEGEDEDDEIDEFAGVLEGEVAREGLLVLLACEDVSAGSRSYLAAPVAASVLRLLLSRTHAPVLDCEHASLVVRLLARMSLSHAHTLLRSGCVRATVEAVLTAGHDAGSLDLLSSAVQLLDQCAAVGTDSRNEAAAILDALCPLTAALRREYTFIPQATTSLVRLRMPTVSRSLDICASPTLLVAGIAGIGVTSFISRLACIATGHFRQWNLRGNEGKIPNNWALEALTILTDNGLLHLWAAALTAHVAAVESTTTTTTPTTVAAVSTSSVVSIEVGVSLTPFVLPQPTLSSLAYALARTVAVFKLADDIATNNKNKVGGGRLRDFIRDTNIANIVSDLFNDADDGSLLSLANVLM